MTLKFSIVIPSFNQAQFIEQTLKSIFSQDYENYEVIVMDGGSSDESLKIIKKYESKISYWQSKKDDGQSAAIKAGFEKAQGNIYAWLNSDDVYLPGAFTKVASYFENNPNVETVTGGGYLIDSEGNPTKIYKVNFTLGVPASGKRFRYYNQNGIYQQSTFWRKEAYEIVGGMDPSFQYIMDRDLFFRLSARKNFGCLPEMLSAFRFHGQNKTLKLMEVHNEEEKLLLKKYHVDRESMWKRKLFFAFYHIKTRIKKLWWIILKMFGKIKINAIKYSTDEINKKIPNFFIIGAPKCGTTALCNYLGSHPNVFICSPKEPEYFDFDFFKEIKINLETYLMLFDKADPKIHMAIGEGSTSYLISECAVREILKFNSTSKFIVMLRNPIELVQSWHAQKAFEGRENILSFEEAWRAGDDRKIGQKIPSSCWEPKQLIYSEWGMLGEQVEKLFSNVAKDRVKVIIFDDFIKTPKQIYEEVLVFLGVPSDGRTEFPKINERKIARIYWLQRIFSRIGFNAQKIKKTFKLTSLGGFVSSLLSLNSKFGSKKEISETFLEELNNYYRDDIRKLSKILNRDLSHWIS